MTDDSITDVTVHYAFSVDPGYGERVLKAYCRVNRKPSPYRKYMWLLAAVIPAILGLASSYAVLIWAV